MQDRRTTAVVYAFRPTLPAMLIGLVGLIALVLGFVSPAQAGGNSGKGGNDDKPWICHPVEGKGELGNGWTLINPDQASRHIDEKTGKGMHETKDGRTDRYAVKSGGEWVCKDRDRDDDDNGDDEDKRWVCHPLEDGEWRLVSPEYAFRHIDEETGKGLHERDGRTDRYAKKVGDKWVCPDRDRDDDDEETPKPTKTSTPTKTTPESPDTGAFTPPPSAPTAPEEAPTAPEEAPLAPAEEAVAPANVVPAAQTDGADLQGSYQPQPGLVGAGALLMMAAGLLSFRRRATE
jgi:hypothetical protein